MQDYQTVSGFLPTAEGSYRHSGVATGKSLVKLKNDPDVTPATIVSPRYYLEDASFLVALEEREGFDGLIDRCTAALTTPKWPIFLGRKACVPTRPVYDAADQRPNDGGAYNDIEDALTRHPWSWLWTGYGNLRTRTQAGPLLALIETAGGTLRRQDALRTNQARQYGFCRRATVRPWGSYISASSCRSYTTSRTCTRRS